MEAARALEDHLQEPVATAAALPSEPAVLAPRGEFDAERFRLIPPGKRTEWQRQVVEDADAEEQADLEFQRRNHEAAVAYLAAQDRAALIQSACQLLCSRAGIVILILLYMAAGMFMP